MQQTKECNFNKEMIPFKNCGSPLIDCFFLIDLKNNQLT